MVVLKSDGSISAPTSSSVDFINSAASNSFAGIAPGEIVTLSGTGLGPSKLVSAQPGDNGFYATQLAGTTVQFNGVAAPLIYTSATQVSAVAPYGVSGADTQVTVTYNGQTSVPATVEVLPLATGVFTLDGSGVGQAAVINQDGSLNNASHPAPIGSVISFYVTGGGQTSPGGVDGQVATLPLPRQVIPLTVAIGGSLVNDPYYLQYAGTAPGEIAGLTQINFLIPRGIPTGSAVPFGLNTSQQGVTIAVSASGN
jgi:trimeric autotransporter adhesin